MAERHPLALSLAAKTKGSPAGTAMVASAPPPEQHVSARAEIGRARRRHMCRLYADLGALLPDLPARAPTTRILEEAIAYVGALRGTVAELEARGAFVGAGRRAVADHGSGAGASAPEVLVAGKASCFAARVPAARRPGALTRMLEVFRRHGVPVLAATVTTHDGEALVIVTTVALALGAVEGIKADISSSVA